MADTNKPAAKPAAKNPPVTPEKLETRLIAAEQEKRRIEKQAQALVTAGKGESPEYDALLEQHRKIHGHKRMLEGMMKTKTAEKETDEAGKNLEHGAKALDDLMKKHLEADEERRRQSQ